MRRDSFVANYEDRRRLLATPFDERLRAGAHNVVAKGLGLASGDDLILITEASTASIAAALVTEASDLGVRVSAFQVDAAFCKDEKLVSRLLASVRSEERTEDRAAPRASSARRRGPRNSSAISGPRQRSARPLAASEPTGAFLDRTLGSVERAGASLLVSSADLPRSFRQRLTEENTTRRHGHMVGVTEEMMRQSVRADFRTVHALGERLIQRLTPPCRIEVRGAPGTHLVISLGREYRWQNQSGMLREPGWTNFPGGEIFTTPSSVEGTLVPDAGVWLPDGRCIGRTGKLRLHFAASRLSHADGPEAPALMEALRGISNARRVGQVALGTNISVLTPIGALLQDLKMPGLHLTLGDSCAQLTHANFSCVQEIPLLMRRPDVRIDGEPLLLRGRYARHLLGGPSFA